MNLDKKVKMLLLVINKQGKEINFEVINRYSEKFDSITSEYHLKKWYQEIIVDKDTGEKKTKCYCIDKEFSRLDQVVKYLLVIKNNLGGNNEKWKTKK